METENKFTENINKNDNNMFSCSQQIIVKFDKPSEN